MLYRCSQFHKYLSCGSLLISSKRVTVLFQLFFPQLSFFSKQSIAVTSQTFIIIINKLFSRHYLHPSSSDRRPENFADVPYNNIAKQCECLWILFCNSKFDNRYPALQGLLLFYNYSFFLTFIFIEPWKRYIRTCPFPWKFQFCTTVHLFRTILFCLHDFLFFPMPPHWKPLKISILVCDT